MIRANPRILYEGPGALHGLGSPVNFAFAGMASRVKRVAGMKEKPPVYAPCRNAAFTLVELMVVIIIIGVLAAIVVPSYLHYAEKARINATKAQINEIENALAGFKLESSRYPSSDEGLAALVSKPSSFTGDWPKEGFMPEVPKDGWGNDFVYIYPGINKTFDIISYGADAQQGGEDENADITN